MLLSEVAMSINIDKELSVREYALRENADFHAPYVPEFDFYFAVKNGDVAKVSSLCSVDFAKKSGFGKLCDDSLQNLKYHFTVSAALIARFCIKSGMTPEEAYSLSDIYIMKADECRTEDDVHAAHTEMIEEYSRRMRLVRNSSIYSKQILRVLDYISEHLHSRIMINEAAKHLQISSAYLSRLFKSETGMAFSDYVNRKKIEEASSLLRFSEYTDLEISTLLCFSSQSYFIKIFKKYVGMTPREYKKRYRLPEFVPGNEADNEEE